MAEAVHHIWHIHMLIHLPFLCLEEIKPKNSFRREGGEYLQGMLENVGEMK